MPKSLYHYTKLTAFKSMIENRSLRFGDYRFMNDPMELLYGYRLLQASLKKVQLEYPHEVNKMQKFADSVRDGQFVADIYSREEVDNYGDHACIVMHQVDQTSSGSYYIFSTSCAADHLPLWDSYANDDEGCCLEVDSLELCKQIESCFTRYEQFDQVSAFSMGISYGDQEAMANLHKKIQQFANSDQFQTRDKGFEELFSPELAEAVCALMGSCKTEGWRSEKEWRIGLYLPDPYLQNNEHASQVFHIKNGVLKPYAELRGLEWNRIVKSVRISPYCHDKEQVRQGVEVFWSHYFPGEALRVDISSIALRT